MVHHSGGDGGGTGEHRTGSQAEAVEIWVYKEAWDRLRGPARVDRIEACADETFAEDFAGGGWALAAELG